jgi:hypothetical protein
MMATRGKPDCTTCIRRSPLLSEEDRMFLAGDLTADIFLETARRRAAAQTRRELGRYTRTGVVAAAITVAFLSAGAGLLALTGKAVFTGTALSISGLTAVLGPMAYRRRRRTTSAE